MIDRSRFAANETYEAKSQRVVYEPGDATRYELIISDLPPTGLRGATHINYALMTVLSPPVGQQVYPFRAGDYISPSYVSEKFDTTWRTACVLTELIAFLLGGTYDADLVANRDNRVGDAGAGR